MSELPHDLRALRRQVAALMPAWEVAGISEFSYLSGGYSNRNYRFGYRGGHYVLRVPDQRAAAVDRQIEHEFYLQAGGTDYGTDYGTDPVAVPELIAYNTRSGAMISRWQEGELLVDTGADARSLISYLQHLHAHLPAIATVYDPVALARRQLAVGDLLPGIREILAGCQWHPAQVCPCHNDLNPWNVILPSSGAWVTLDWEWFGGNDPLFDLVTLHQGLELENALLPDARSLPALARQLLGSACDEARLHNCVVAFWLREHAWAHAQLRAGNHRTEIREQLHTSAQRLLRL